MARSLSNLLLVAILAVVSQQTLARHHIHSVSDSQTEPGQFNEELFDGQVPDISDDPFIFEADQLPTEANVTNMRYMASVGNGHLATNVQTDTIYVNGLFTGERGWSHRARVRPVHSINITSIQLEGTETLCDYAELDRNYQLNITRAVFEETVTCPDVATAVFRTYAHRFHNRLLVTEIEIKRLSSSDEAIAVGYESLNGESDEGDITFEPTQEYNTGSCSDCWFKQGQINEEEIFGESGFTEVFVYYNALPEEDGEMQFILEQGDNEFIWSFFFSIDIGIQGSSLNGNESAQTDFDGAIVADREALLTTHVEAWQDLWNSGHITVEGDLNLHKIITGSFYYLYSNLPSVETQSPNNQFFSLSPGGLANGRNGSDYYGHVFWDTEFWMYPSILLFRHDYAREILNYRIYGMDRAFERAASSVHGEFQGIRFPWESAFTGAEATPDVCPRCRENQQHITGDIAFAARQYLATTRDTEWLNTSQTENNDYTGFDFIKEMARFWYSRPTYSFEKEKYEVNFVMPPDEHHTMVNNSIFTNTVGSMAIHFGRYAACLAGKNPEIEIPDRWVNVAEQIYFPYNAERRYHEEFEGYDERVFRGNLSSNLIKQADVVMLGFPLMRDMPVEVRRRDLIHYENFTTELGPAMTWGMYAIGWLELGEVERAEELFNRSYQPYVRQPYKIWTEAQQGAGAVNFITGMGGFLQGLMYGYAGLRLNVESMDFSAPVLPPGLTRVNIVGLDYLGNQLDITYDADEVIVTLTSAVEEAMVLHLQIGEGEPAVLTEGQAQAFAVQPFHIFTPDETGCELPRDFIDMTYDVEEPPTPEAAHHSIPNVILYFFTLLSVLVHNNYI